jgi:hypothetical protein
MEESETITEETVTGAMQAIRSQAGPLLKVAWQEGSDATLQSACKKLDRAVGKLRKSAGDKLERHHDLSCVRELEEAIIGVLEEASQEVCIGLLFASRV